MTTLAQPLTKCVDLDGLRRWAELSGDHNPLHTDPAFAATTPYGSPIVHGHLTLTWLMQWAMANEGVAFATGGGLQELRFLAPLHADVQYVVGGRLGSDGEVIVEVRAPDGTTAVEARLAMGHDRGDAT